MVASKQDLASVLRANGLRIGTSIPDCRYASTRARHCSGVPAMLVASISSSLTARAGSGAGQGGIDHLARNQPALRWQHQDDAAELAALRLVNRDRVGELKKGLAVFREVGAPERKAPV